MSNKSADHAMPTQPDSDRPEAEAFASHQIDEFLAAVMDVQRKYANEMKNARSNRLSEMKIALDEHTAPDSQ